VPQPQETDVVIVGAGPVGLFAVFECGMLHLACHVVDALPHVGGQCSALYPEKPIYDIPGQPAILAGELIERLQEQAAPFKPVYHLGQQATALTREDDGRWRLTTSAGTEILAHAVFVAAGAGAFGPNRPPLPGIEAFENEGVLYSVRRKADLAGKRVVIAGGGDSAVDWAVALADVAAHVYVVHRRPQFRAAPETVARMQALAAEGKGVELVIPFQLHDLEGVPPRLGGVVVRDLDGNLRRLEADVLLPFFGLSMDLGPIAKWGLGLDRSHVKVEPTTCATDAPGVFAIGDVASYPHKLKLILTGFAEAAAAAHAAYAIARPDQALHWEYSTTKGPPAAAA